MNESFPATIYDKLSYGDVDDHLCVNGRYCEKLPSDPSCIYGYGSSSLRPYMFIAKDGVRNRQLYNFHPVEEYKKMSLRDLLDLSDDFLFPENENGSRENDGITHKPWKPYPPVSRPSSVYSSNMAVSETSVSSSECDDVDWTPLDAVSFPLHNSEDIPLAAELIGSMDMLSGTESSDRNKKRSRDEFVLEYSTDKEEIKITEVKKGSRSVSSLEDDRRFRRYQEDQWKNKYRELCQYHKETGNCLVPHTYNENLALARWVKRQRYQYKLMSEGKSSTMTKERIQMLEQIDFVWDSQAAAWGERLSELQQFLQIFGHCNVPSNYCENPQLATWVKCQRRQYKLFMEGKYSNMTVQRVQELEKLGFEWELRSYKRQRTD